MRRIAVRTLPDGTLKRLQPFHICMRGLETVVLCRTDEDYDAMVKILCVSAWRSNVIIIIYTVVSNHCHVCILAETQIAADAFCADVKKTFSMWFRKRYGEAKILHGVDMKALCLDTEWYVRNALAYVVRNILDNGGEVNSYPWSGYRAMFSNDEAAVNCRAVSSLAKREREAIMHTGEKLTGVPWLIDSDCRMVPHSICDCLYLEQCFENDQAFFLKSIGSVNTTDMHYNLEERPYQLQSDTEFYKSVEDTCQRWFTKSLSEISIEQKNRLVPYIYHTRKTTIPQLSRVTGIPRDSLARMLKKR